MAEVLLGVLGGDGRGGDAEPAADRRGDLAEGDAFLGDGMKSGPRGRRLERQAVEAADVAPVGGRPAVATVAQVAGDPRRAGGRDQARDEAVVLAAVHRRRQPDDGGPHPPLGESDHGVLGVDPRTTGPHVALREPPLEAGEDQRAGRVRPDEGFVRPLERGAHRLDRPQVRVYGAGEVARVLLLVLEREMDDAVGLADRRAQAVEVVQVAPSHVGAERLHGGHRAIRASQAGDSVTCGQQLGDDRGGDVPGGTGDEYAHS